MKIHVSLLLGLVFLAFGADGTLDTAFNGTGLFVSSFASDALIRAVITRYDGKLVIGGSIVNGTAGDFALLILNEDGTVDGALHQNHVGVAGSIDTINGLAIQPDLKVIAVGQSIASGGYPSQFVVARYCANGALDLSFGVGGVTTIDFLPVAIGPGPISASASAVALMRDGRIVVVGSAQDVGNDATNPEFYAVVVLRTDGSLDSSFASGAGRRIYATAVIPGNVSSVANAVAIQSINTVDNIILAGEGTVAGAEKFQIVRILQDGSLDLTFAANGVDEVVFNAGANEIANGLDVYPNGTIIAVGSSMAVQSEAVLTRRLIHGGPDNSFAGTGSVTFVQAGVDITGRAVNVQNNGSVLLVGDYVNSPAFSFFTARFLSAGSLDSTFNPNVTPGYNLEAFSSLANAASAFAVALQSDGKIVIAGSLVLTDASLQMGVLRYLNDNAIYQVFVEPMFLTPANISSNCLDNPPTLSGVAQNPSNITVYVNGVENGRIVTIGSSNTWSFTPVSPLIVGPNTFQIVSEYKSGNMNAISAFVCCGIGLGVQSCISAAIRQKYCPSCIVTPINVLCNVA